MDERMVNGMSMVPRTVVRVVVGVVARMTVGVVVRMAVGVVVTMVVGVVVGMVVGMVFWTVDDGRARGREGGRGRRRGGRRDAGRRECLMRQAGPPGCSCFLRLYCLMVSQPSVHLKSTDFVDQMRDISKISRYDCFPSPFSC